MWVSCDKTFLSVYKNFDRVTLTLNFDLLLIKLNLGYNFLTKRDMAFILQVCFPCGKTFLFLSKVLTSTFYLLLKKLNLGHIFWTKTDRASVLLMARPFFRYQIFLTHNLDFNFCPNF